MVWPGLRATEAFSPDKKARTMYLGSQCRPTSRPICEDPEWFRSLDLVRFHTWVLLPIERQPLTVALTYGVRFRLPMPSKRQEGVYHPAFRMSTTRSTRAAWA